MSFPIAEYVHVHGVANTPVVPHGLVAAVEVDVVMKPTVNDEITANADRTIRKRRSKPPTPALVRPRVVGLMRQTHFLEWITADRWRHYTFE